MVYTTLLVLVLLVSWVVECICCRHPPRFHPALRHKTGLCIGRPTVQPDDIEDKYRAKAKAGQIDRSQDISSGMATLVVLYTYATALLIALNVDSDWYTSTLTFLRAVCI